MYYEYFGFRQAPFKITPDTSLFYPGGDRGAILDALSYAILNGEGIVKVVGEVGSGKTMLCRMLEKELPEKVEVVYLVNPSISPENTLHAIAFELKLGIQSTTSRFEVMNVLQQYLLQRHSQNRQVVVFVEEAQSMPIATLEEIRLLSNLETQQSKLLQIVLFGQPELDEMIALPEIRQLKERITYSFQLAPFKINDIREYINSRVRACGYRAGDLFSDAAIKQIEYYSKGLLRRINILADKSLLAAFADNSHTVSAKHARLAARDSEFVPRSNWSTRSILVACGAAALLAIATLYLLLPDQSGVFGPTGQGPVSTGMASQSTAEITPAPTPVVQSNPAPEINTGVQQEVAVSGLKQDNEPLSIEFAVKPVTFDSALSASEAADAQNDDSHEQPAANTQEITTNPDTILPTDRTDNDTVINNKTLTPVIGIATNNTLELEEVSGNMEVLEEDKPISSPAGTSPGPQESAENQLPGLSPIYQVYAIGDSSLTPSEEIDLQDQLVRLPPESAENQSQAVESDICQQCWSIIYRPVVIMKNL